MLRWTGKLVGGILGLVTLGPFGALLGVVLGHQLDEAQSAPELTTAADTGEQFFRIAFRVMGYLAKSDGRVSEKEIAAARTFVFYEDIAPLLEKGLIKGGTLESAVVIRGDTALSKHPLRYPEEFVRHKILDVVGDLALFGRRIMGHVIAVRPGHGPNTELAKALLKTYNEMRAMVPAPFNIPTGEAVMNVNELMKILPHRYPFLLVDRIVGFEGDNKCTGMKNVTINEPFFQGHFPNHPIMPGVLQLEAMAQVASILLLRIPEHQGKMGYFMSADNVKWRRPVLPGDTLIIEAELLKVKRSIGQAKGRCIVNGQVVSEADLMFSLVDR